MKEELLYRLPGGIVAHLKMNSIGKILKEKGLDNTGDVQMFHTQNVLRRITKYMPFRTGMTIKVTIAQTDIRKPEITTNVPYGQFLWRGKVMRNAKTGNGPSMVPGVGLRYRKGSVLKPVPRDIEYTKNKNKKAGPYWDKAVSTNEGDAMRADLQRFIDRRGGR